MSSSREVTVKKKDVWEEAGSEFYQESYPSGSKPPSTHHRRPSRLALPLPSQTARRGSLLHGRHKSAARRKQSVTAFTYTSTMAATVDANGTTTNANDIQVSILPDLSEETILNERKTWEELLRIKTMPVPMAQKKLLKAQLTNLPKLRLKGWSHVCWMMKKWWKSFKTIMARKRRHILVFNNSLRSVELRGGTSIVNVFRFIKSTLLLNLVISLVLFTFIIGPHVAYDLFHATHMESTPYAKICNTTNEGDDIDLDDPSDLDKFLQCCRAQYKEELENPETGRGFMTALFKHVGMQSFEKWPASFSYYYEPHIIYNNSTEYTFDAAYVLAACAIFILCLLLMVKSIAQGVREVIQIREGEFYKYSNLIFAGWDHYTSDETGSNFKRQILRNEMKIALQSEKKKMIDLQKTKRQTMKIYLIRIFVNILILFLVVVTGFAIIKTSVQVIKYDVTDLEESSTNLLYTLGIGFGPSVVITSCNLLFPIVLLRLGKLENFSQEWETTLVLLRALFIRLVSVYAAAYAFIRETYCTPKEGFCTQCDHNQDHPLHRRRCWEAIFAEQIYRLLLTDIVFKIVITFILDPTRRLIKHCCKNRAAQKIGKLSFNTVRHSLDIIYIQILSWMSFYFAPCAPIVAVIYCFLMFYIKKFSLLYNCKSVPDTFRTIRTTTMFMMAKIIAFVAVLVTFIMIVGFMVPSRECGVFAGKLSAWTAVEAHFKEFPQLNTFVDQAISPGVAVPTAIALILTTYYYYSVAQANRAMVDVLKNLLLLEGHDKQYLFAKLNSLRRKSQSNSPTTEDVTLNHP